MSVKKGDRRESKIEFQNKYFVVHDDAVRLIKNSFGASKELREEYQGYIGILGKQVLDRVFELGSMIKMANSIYPTNALEQQERRLYQDKAIGICFDLLNKYQLVMNLLKVADDKYTVEIGNLTKQINSLRNWRKSDNARFKNIG